MQTEHVSNENRRNAEHEIKRQEQESNRQTQESKRQEQESKRQDIRVPARVIMRDYSKGVFFYPLAIFSIVAALIEHIGESNDPSQPWLYANTLSMIWIVLFFVSVFIVSFDLSAGKFIAVVFLLVIVVLLIVFLSLNSAPSTGGDFVFNIQLRTQFYWMTAAILGVIVLFTYIVGQFHYVKIERNEVLVKGILGSVMRFPTGSLNYEKSIPDVLKFMLLGSGTIVFHVPGSPTPVELKTVIHVNRKARQMDAILSTIKASR